MSKDQLTKEKSCIVYSGDYHFEMISLPYISKNMDNNKKIVVLNENNLEDTINVLISRINLKENKKQELLNLDWSNNIKGKLNKIKNIADESKEAIVFIKGSINFIENQNKKISEINNRDNINIVDCYEIQEVMNNLNDIMSKYSTVINTVGEKQIQKLF